MTTKTDTELVTIPRGTLDQFRQVAADAADMLECNCTYDPRQLENARCDGTCTHSMALAALAAPAPSEAVWWVVTMRRCGDDEDSLYIVQATDEMDPCDVARARYIEEVGIEEPVEGDEGDEPEFYFNHVVRCIGAKPEHVQAAPA